MNGTFSSPESRGDVTVLSGTCPVSEMGSYTKEVMQYTHGKGKLACILKGYEPCHNAEEVIESIGYDCDADLALSFARTVQVTMCHGMKLHSICICRVFLNPLRRTA